MATIAHLVFLAIEGVIYLAAGLHALTSEHHQDMCVYYWLIAGTLGSHATTTAYFAYRRRKAAEQPDVEEGE